MQRLMFRALRLVAIVCLLIGAARAQDYDVLVYGATPGGIAAALSAADSGRSVLLVEPTSRIGGMVTNGLSHTDFRTFEGLTGTFLDFTHRVLMHYGGDAAICFRGAHAEPKVNLAVWQAMLAERKNKIEVWTDRALEGVRLSGEGDSSGDRSLEIALFGDEENKRYPVAARYFIDATYEGDLMAASRIPYRVGREGRDEFGESLAPAQPDTELQAYNFRLCLTKVPENRAPIRKPEGWKRTDYTGVIPLLEKGKLKSVFCETTGGIFKAQEPPLPGGKYDINDVSKGIVRLSLPGENSAWPDGAGGAFIRRDDETDVGGVVPFSRTGLRQSRARVFDEHLRWDLGLLYFLQNDDAVPKRFREEARAWGLPRDEFDDNGHLPLQLYVREARRMRGAYVFVQQDAEHAADDARAPLHTDSIAMGDYGLNCHGTAHTGSRFGGQHTGEFYQPGPPYQIPYGTILPPEHGGVDNLLVPVAVSATHVGFCAIRLEPIWTSLGQAAGLAAAIACERKCSVHRVPVAEIQSRLHRAGAATIYVSDVLPGHPDFAMVQWWGTAGGFHGLAPKPAIPGPRGKSICSQYYEAFPEHAADLDRPLDAPTAARWPALAKKLEIPNPPSTDGKTRGAWLREVWARTKK